MSGYQKVRAVECFYEYLLDQRKVNATPFSELIVTGAGYVLAQIHGAIKHAKNASLAVMTEEDPLDFRTDLLHAN